MRSSFPWRRQGGGRCVTRTERRWGRPEGLDVEREPGWAGDMLDRQPAGQPRSERLSGTAVRLTDEHAESTSHRGEPELFEVVPVSPRP